MTSTYLQPADYDAYGVPGGATAAQVTAASALIDSYLKRPDGLLWAADAGGNPGWMAGKSPVVTLTLGAAIGPGSNVVAIVTGGIQAVSVGEVLILDRASSGPSVAEAAVVAAMTLPTGGNPATVTLQSVAYAHAEGASADLGLAIKQHKFLPKGRPLTTLAFTPAVRLLSGQGRYGYGRRGDTDPSALEEFNLLAALSHFGGPPAWEFFPLENTGVDPGTGQVWVPAGVMLAYYSEVNLWYVAGWTYANLPDAVKFACARLVTAAANLPPLGNVKSYKAGDTAIAMFAASLMDDDIKRELEGFRAKLYN